MTVEELITLLEKYESTTKVKLWDSDEAEWKTIESVDLNNKHARLELFW
jgi:hypothetical protein